MAVGQGSNLGALSYLAIGRETTLGTAVTASAGIDFLSSSIKTMQEGKILEQVERSRTMSKRIKLGKNVSGDFEFYLFPNITATGYILQNAFGGTVTSATATGETIGGGAFTHTFNIGSMDQTYKSLTVNERKGDSTNGKVFQYNGVRVNELTFKAEIDDAVRCTASLVGMDSTVGATDVESLLTITSSDVLSFDSGRFSAETSFASLTSTSFWHVQNIEFKISNNLKSDSESRRIGTNILSVLPPGVASFDLKATIRFDTTTAYDAMLDATKLSGEFEFLLPTLSGSAIRPGLKIRFPEIYVNEAGDPEIEGPDEILTSEVTFHVLRDDTSATGYAVQALLTNNLSSV